MKKTILLAIYINLLAAQIQYSGSPNFYNQQFERINSVQINPNTIIDRNFDPMVFQFGREYLVDIDVMSEAEVILNQDNTYTLLLSVSSDGAYGLGSTKGETVTQVVLPAAFPGLVGAFLLAVSRAIGETMIVVMAVGVSAKLTINPLESVTTVPVQIVMLLTGDNEFDSIKTMQQ